MEIADWVIQVYEEDGLGGDYTAFHNLEHVFETSLMALEFVYANRHARGYTDEDIRSAVIAGLEYDEFQRIVAPGNRGGVIQKERLRSIWQKAVDSIGCDGGEVLEFEGKVMVEEQLGEQGFEATE